MLGYIISDRNNINAKNYKVQSFNVLHKTDLNIYVVENNKVLYKNDIIENASKYGHVQVLIWYLKSYNNEIYDKIYDIIINASKYGHIQIFEWFKQNNYVIKSYQTLFRLIYYASHNGHVQILEWFKKSGYKIKYDKKIFETSFYKVLNFFVHNIKVKKIVQWHKKHDYYKYLNTFKFKTKNNYIKGYNKN